MAPQELLKLIASLSTEERVAVEEFVRYLKENSKNRGDFRNALDSFVRDHPELLRRLAQ